MLSRSARICPIRICLLILSWDQSIKTYLPTTVAYTGIYDVNSKTSAKIDDMESFWFAEVLKYL